MEVDFTNPVIWGLVIVVVMLMMYIAYRFREGKITLESLSPDDFMARIKEAEKLMQIVKVEVCWNCGSTDKEVFGNLYEDNEIVFKCTKCQTQTIWRRGKREWQLTTGTQSYVAKLTEKLKGKGAPIV